MLLFSKVKDLNEGSWEEQTLRISGWLKGLVHSTNKYSCQKLCFMSGTISSSNRLVFFPHNSSPPPLNIRTASAQSPEPTFVQS